MADKERVTSAGKPRGEKKPSLDSILAFDRLEVGPVVVEKRRVVAPYTIVSGSKRDSTELIYKYEEDVFDPQDPEDVNLASMMAAQVAMNYGLFTHEIVLKGSYDRHDQRFLLDVAENTAREIYVVKLLMANPFITGPASSLTPERLKKYCRANIVFEGSAPAAFQKKKVNHSRYAILSSGGKDSLLSYGIIKEMGKDAHPIFINESGRHWYTAMNSYRHFSEKVPNTARVWTNSDRVFNWMLRQMPFVRQDFAKVRSDEYPLRLWTVAVFLFGAMPLAKKRGLGRIVIGDEYDTTVKMSYKGITHYNGLYDQSRYFDNALTRYYGRKGWNMAQFSLLRPMSEMLIEKMLAERYPDLLEQQVSCHATHLEDNRAVPCGQCEKCRRIVGMLLAVGKDPKKCGYTEKQMELCLSALENMGVHQETVGAEHLAHMLSEKGMLGGGKMGNALARPHQEIMSLRFDKEKSPPNYLPLDIRMQVLALMLGHAHGVVQRNGKMWVGMDVKNSMQFKLPYPHSSTSKNGDEPGKVQDGSTQEDGYILGEMTWPVAGKRLAEVDLALLPVGAIEQHGLHLPLDTDAFDADFLAKSVAERCADPKPIVLPLIPYGVSYHHEDFSGTISISPETLSKIVYDVGMGIAKQGITKLIIINGHGGNTPSLKYAAQMINRDAHIFTTVDTGETSDSDISTVTETPGDVHSGEVETSTALATRPHLVRMEEAEAFVPGFSSKYMDFSSKHSLEWYARTAKISRTGVLGDPTKASAEKGEKIWEMMISNLVDFVEHIKSMSLDEMYQRRY